MPDAEGANPVEETAPGATDGSSNTSGEGAIDGGLAAVDAAPVDPDPVLLASVELAREALLQITPAETVGEVIGSVAHEVHVLSLHFATSMPGYPGWHWTVTLSRIDAEAEANVLEVELLPGDGAVLAPEWIPWSERLADYRAAQNGAEEDVFVADDDLEDDSDDDLDLADGVLAEDDDLDEQVVIDDEDDDDLEDDDSEDVDSDGDDLDDSDDDDDDDDAAHEDRILSDEDPRGLRR